MAPSEGQVHASGIVLQHYAEPDKDTGLCLPSWRVTSSSIVYSPNLASGTATTVSCHPFRKSTVVEISFSAM